MGSGIFKCCKEAAAFQEIDSEGEEDPYARDILIIRNMMSCAPSIVLAITVSYPDGKVRAVVPEDFQPDLACMKDLISAFKGSTKGLERRYITIGPEIPTYVPGKLVDGRIMYCMGMTEKKDGCVVLKTRSCLLIAVYSDRGEICVRIAEDTAHHMIENDL